MGLRRVGGYDRSARIFVILISLAFCTWGAAQESHSHSVPEQLGTVSFPISCQTGVQEEFNRGVALLHSFAYAAAAESFQKVARQDPKCAIAHWGIAMTGFHQLWEPPIGPAEFSAGELEINESLRIGSASSRTRIHPGCEFHL